MPIEPRQRGELGFSMLELIVTLLIFSITVLGLGAATVYTSRLLQRSHTQTDGFVAVQWQAETLRNQGYDAVQSGSAPVMGYDVNWDVRGTNPKRVVLTVRREAVTGSMEIQRRRSMVDSLVIYVSPNR
jgi:prepilin-type N-terminal cleavage/methylation domain-containing protein